MDKVQIIRVEIHKPGRGTYAYESKSCPLKKNGICRLEFIKCDYGLTETSVPSPRCPMEQDTTITLKFSAIQPNIQPDH